MDRFFIVISPAGTTLECRRTPVARRRLWRPEHDRYGCHTGCGVRLCERAHTCGHDTARSTAVGPALVNAATCTCHCDNRAIDRNAAPRIGVLSHADSCDGKAAGNVSALKRARVSSMSGTARSASTRRKATAEASETEERELEEGDREDGEREGQKRKASDRAARERQPLTRSAFRAVACATR